MKLVSVLIIFPTVLNVVLYLIQDSFIKKSDFHNTSVEIMLRFYEYFDPAVYQNAGRTIFEPTVVEDKEIAAGHYVSAKYESDENNKLPQETISQAMPIPHAGPR